jgi:hypothetical protein
MESLPEADCVIVPGALVLDGEQLSDVLRDRMDARLRSGRGRTDRLLLSGTTDRRITTK